MVFGARYHTLIVVDPQHCDSMYDPGLSGHFIVISNSCNPVRKKLTDLNISHQIWLVPDEETDFSKHPQMCLNPRLPFYYIACRFENKMSSIFLTHAFSYLQSDLVTLYHYQSNGYVTHKLTIPRSAITPWDHFPAENSALTEHTHISANDFAEYPLAEDTIFHMIWTKTQTQGTFNDSGLTSIIDNSIKNICGVDRNNTIMIWVSQDEAAARDFFSTVKERVRNNHNNVQRTRNFIGWSPSNIDDCRIVIQTIDLDTDDMDTPFAGKLRQFWNKHSRKRSFYAHFSDLYRTIILFKYGGWYIDTDVLVLRPVMSDKAIIAGERSIVINAPMFFPRPGHPLLTRLSTEMIRNIEFYNTNDWHGFMIMPLYRAIKEQTDESDFVVLETYATLLYWHPIFAFDYTQKQVSPASEEFFRNGIFPMMHWAGLAGRYEHLCMKMSYNKALLNTVLGPHYDCAGDRAIVVV